MVVRLAWTVFKRIPHFRLLHSLHTFFLRCPFFVCAPFSLVPHFRWCPFFRWCPEKNNKTHCLFSLVPHFRWCPFFGENGAPLKMGHPRKWGTLESIPNFWPSHRLKIVQVVRFPRRERPYIIRERYSSELKLLGN